MVCQETGIQDVEAAVFYDSTLPLICFFLFHLCLPLFLIFKKFYSHTYDALDLLIPQINFIKVQR